MKFEDMKLRLYAETDRVYLRTDVVSDGWLLSLGNIFGIFGARRIPTINKKLGFDLDEKRRLKVFKGDKIPTEVNSLFGQFAACTISQATALDHKFVLLLVPYHDMVVIFDETADFWLLCMTPQGVYRFSDIDNDYILPVDHLGRLKILR